MRHRSKSKREEKEDFNYLINICLIQEHQQQKFEKKNLKNSKIIISTRLGQSIILS
jgi:hypothetical protein